MRAVPRVVLAAAFLAVLLALPTASVAAQSFTLEEVLSAPFPDQLVGARDADVVAWVSNDRGARNVWVARGPDWRGRRVTEWEEDDGQEIAGLELDPHGRWIVFTRGGASNREGWTPAPALEVRGAERVRYFLPLDRPDAEPVELDGWGTLSPDGTRIAWTEDNRILVASFSVASDSAGATGDTTVVATVRRGAGSLDWSPDGTRIAFVSSRDRHGFVGVAAADGSGFHFVDPHLTRDSEVVWSPDGRRIAFLRQWAGTEAETLPFFPRPEAEIPWQIVVADADGSDARVAFTADPGVGSRFQGVSSERNLWWTVSGRLVFPWEKDGWKRLWSVAPEGGEPTLLTPGAHVIQHAALAPDGRTLVFDSNRDDLNRKHVWRVQADGGGLEQLTPGDGVEWAPVPLASGALAFLGSGAREPARAWVLPPRSDDRVALQGPLTASFPAADRLVEPVAVTFPATDGLTIHAQLFLPPALEPGERRPALMFLHGGSRRQMLLGFHNRGYYHNAYAMNQYMASRGYVVLAVNYRSGVGYGLAFREAEEYGASGASEVRDVIGAGLYLAGRPDVDPTRIGLWGGSYGGFLTAQGLVHAPELFAAGVDIHGVHDWNVGIGNFRPDYEPENMPEVAAKAFASSPLSRVDRWEDPVLLIHGDDDRNVRFRESITLAKELEVRGVPWGALVFPDEVHGFLRHANWLAAYGATERWFDRWLGG